MMAWRWEYGGGTFGEVPPRPLKTFWVWVELLEEFIQGDDEDGLDDEGGVNPFDDVVFGGLEFGVVGVAEGVEVLGGGQVAVEQVHLFVGFRSIVGYGDCRLTSKRHLPVQCQGSRCAELERPPRARSWGMAIPDAKRAIRDRSAAGETQKALAAQYGANADTIHRVIKKR